MLKKILAGLFLAVFTLTLTAAPGHAEKLKRWQDNSVQAWREAVDVAEDLVKSNDLKRNPMILTVEVKDDMDMGRFFLTMALLEAEVKQRITLLNEAAPKAYKMPLDELSRAHEKTKNLWYLGSALGLSVERSKIQRIEDAAIKRQARRNSGRAPEELIIVTPKGRFSDQALDAEGVDALSYLVSVQYVVTNWMNGE